MVQIKKVENEVMNIYNNRPELINPAAKSFDLALAKFGLLLNK